MAQALPEKPLTAIQEEVEVNKKSGDLMVSAPKASHDLPAANRGAKATDEDLLIKKAADLDLSGAKANAISDIAGKKNRIQVSNTKKPLFFYLNLAKRYIKQYNDVELSALGMAIPTVVTIAEMLKANGVAVEKKVLTSTIESKDEHKGRVVQKAKIEIVLEKMEAENQPEE